MTDEEVNRAIQYVTARTSYGRDMVAEILRVGVGELSHLATSTTHTYDRGSMMEYVCQWTIRKTGQPEPLVREVLGCAGRWLDQMCEQIAREHPELLQDAQ